MSHFDSALLNPNVAVVPNPIEDNGWSVLRVAGLSIFAACFWVCVRFYTRTRLVFAIGWEDFMVVISLILGVATCASVIKQVEYGLGKHTYYVRENIQEFLYYEFVATTLHNFSLAFTKISILVLYFHLFPVEYAQRGTKILLVITLLVEIFTSIVYLTRTIPVYAFWDLSVQVNYSHPRQLFWVCSVFHVITDILIYLLPVPIVIRLRIPKRKRVALCMVFTAGFAVVLVSAFRFINFAEGPGYYDADLTWNYARTASLSCIEVSGMIMCACLATLKPLAAKLCPICSKFFWRGRQRFIPASTPPTIGSIPHRLREKGSDSDEHYGSDGAQVSMDENGHGASSGDREKQGNTTCACQEGRDVEVDQAQYPGRFRTVDFYYRIQEGLPHPNSSDNKVAQRAS